MSLSKWDQDLSHITTSWAFVQHALVFGNAFNPLLFAEKFIYESGKKRGISEWMPEGNWENIQFSCPNKLCYTASQCSASAWSSNEICWRIHFRHGTTSNSQRNDNYLRGCLQKYLFWKIIDRTLYGNVGFSFTLFKEGVTVKTETKQNHMVDHFFFEYWHLYKTYLGQTRISKSLIKSMNFTADAISLGKWTNISVFYT